MIVRRDSSQLSFTIRKIEPKIVTIERKNMFIFSESVSTIFEQSAEKRFVISPVRTESKNEVSKKHFVRKMTRKVCYLA